MDLSTLSQSTPVRASEPEHSSYFNSSHLPWKSSEIEAFRKFLIASKRDTRSSKSGTNLTHSSLLDFQNLCIIKGHTGSGKMTTIRTLCQDLNIKLVEFDQFNTMLNNEKEFENGVDHLIRFLQSSLSRNTLRSHRLKPIISQPGPLGSRSFKRVRSSRDEECSASPNSHNTAGSDEEEDSQVVLIYDLPRVLLNCKYTSLYPIQSIIGEVLNSDRLYPLVIVALDSKEDNSILRRLLSSNYTKDPRCLVITLKEITKTKIFSILKLRKSTLVNHIIDMSSGDIRYILNNLKFYNICAEFNTREIYDYMLERNNLNNFNLLGKILFNKRAPIQKIAGQNVSYEAAGSNYESPSLGTLDTICSSFTGFSSQDTPYLHAKSAETSPADDSGAKSGDNTPTTGGYSKLRRGSRLQSSASEQDTGDDKSPSSPTNSRYDDLYLKFEQCFSMCRPVTNQVFVESEEPKSSESASSSQDKGLSTQERLKKSVDRVPVEIKLEGITEEFDPSRPLSYTKWPKLVPEDGAPPFRQSSARMLPKLTRPLLGYRPEQLVDTIKCDPIYFCNCLFDNYSDMYGHLDDCSTLTRHFASADVFYSNNRFNQDYEVIKHFLAICIRATADSNIHGFDVARRGFHQFIPHSNYKLRIDQVKGLIHELKLEMSKNDLASYTHEALLLEIIPVLSMVTAEEEAVTEAYSQTQSQAATTDNEYDILDVMEQVEMMMEKRETSSSSAAKKNKESYVFSTKLNEIVQEMSKYYVPKQSEP